MRAVYGCRRLQRPIHFLLFWALLGLSGPLCRAADAEMPGHSSTAAVGEWRASGEGQWHWGPRSPRSGFSDRWVRWRLPLPDSGFAAGPGTVLQSPIGPGGRSTAQQSPHGPAEAVLEIGNPFVPHMALALYDGSGRRIDSLQLFGSAVASPVRMPLRTLGGPPERRSPSPLYVVERPDPLYQLPIAWNTETGGWVDLWVRGDGSNRVFPVTLWSPERLEHRQGERLGVMAAFLAVLLAVLVFGGLFSTVVSTDFGWPYLLWVASGMAYLVAVSGLGYAYAYPLHYHWHVLLPVLFGNATAWSLLLVLQRLYRTQPLYPILHRVFELTRILLLVFGLVSFLLPWMGTGATRSVYLAQEALWLEVSVLVFIAPLAFAVRRKHPESPLLFLALGPLAVGVGMETLENMGLVQWAFRTQVLHWIGTASAVLLTAPILLFRMRRKIEEGFQWEGAALLRRRLDAFVLFQREARLRENLQQAIQERLGPLIREVEEGLERLQGGAEASPAGEPPLAAGAAGLTSTAAGPSPGGAALPTAALDHARERLASAKAELRVIAENRLPTDLVRQDLAPALEGLAEPLRADGVVVDIDLTGLPGRWDPDPITRMALFRTAQGLLSNVLQHARARHCWLELSGTHRELVLRVRDDGIGLPSAGWPDAYQTDGNPPEQPPMPRGRGMDILRQRVQALGGSVHWTGAAGQGTECVVHIPLTL